MSIFPGCNRCGQCGCTCGKLPYTVTVTFSGLQDKSHSAHAPLTISSNFGTGAAAVAMAPGGDSTGPLTSVLLLDGGCGYAKLGHVEPTVSASGGGGSGAAFTPTLEPVNLAVSTPCRTWKLASLAMTGGSGYVVGETLTINAVDGSIEASPALAIIAYGRTEPAITATAPGGSGAVLAVMTAQTDDIPETWIVESIAVEDGGAGYTDGDYVAFSVGASDTEVAAATAKVATRHEEPTLSASAPYDPRGTGAQLGTPVLTPTGDGYWRVSSVPVIDGGAGYTAGYPILITVVDGNEVNSAWAHIGGVSASGAITSIFVQPYYRGKYFKDTGEIESVSVSGHGKYYGELGTPGAVIVVNGGEYYKESKTAPPCVADVTITSGCTGATFDAVIDDTVGSPTFGEITAVTINTGGYSNCQAWGWRETGQSALNDIPLVLVADSPVKLVTTRLDSCFGSGGCVVVNAVGERAEPSISLFVPSPECGRGIVTPTLSQQEDDQGRPYWTVESATASGGTGYADESAVSTDLSPPCLQIAAPSITAFATGGVLTSATVNSGGQFWNQLKYDGQPGAIREIELTAPGSGYAKLGREEPTLTIAGGNATFSFSLSQQQDDCGIDYWSIASVTASGGTGYTPGQQLTVSVAEGDTEGQAAVLTVQAGSDGVPTGITVARGGVYYRENASLDPYVADVTPVILQLAPSDGSGAQISVTVDDDTASPQFGQIKSVHLDNGGADYQILGAPHDCSYSAITCHGGSPYTVSMALRGRGKKPRISVTSPYEYGATVVLEADSVLGNCNSLPSSASLLVNAEAGSATIEAGGAVETDCDTVGYCDRGPGDCIVGSPPGCPTINWTMQFTLNNPHYDPSVPHLGIPSGQYSFSGPFPIPSLPVEQYYSLPRYDPDIPWMTRFCEDNYQFSWPGLAPWEGYFYDPYGSGSVSVWCQSGRFYVQPFVGAQGMGCSVFCGNGGFLPFGLMTATAKLVPAERVNGLRRIKAGTHHFDWHSQGPANGYAGNCSYDFSVDLTVSY